MVRAEGMKGDLEDLMSQEKWSCLPVAYPG